MKNLIIPFFTTSIKTDLILTIILIPVWWVLGFNIFIYHFVIAWSAIKLLVFSSKNNKEIHIPKFTLYLFCLIFIYGYSILVNLPYNQSIRTVASLYNYSFWIMGGLLIIIVYNSVFLKDVLVIAKAFKINIIFIGFFTIVTLFLWQKGYRELKFPTLLLLGAGRITHFRLLMDTATIQIFKKDFLSSLYPRISILSPYPTALGSLILLILPLVMGYDRIKRGRVDLFQLCVIGLGILALLLSLSRMSILALLISIIVVYILKRKQRIAILLLILLVFFFLSPLLIKFFEWLFFDLRENSAIGRFSVYKYTLDMLFERNPILGIGVKPREKDFPIPIGSHSTYLSLLLKSGFTGLIMFILFQLNILWKWFKMRLLAMNREQKILWGCIGISLISMSLWMLTEDLDAPQLVAFLYFLLIGIMAVLNKAIKGESAI